MQQQQQLAQREGELIELHKALAAQRGRTQQALAALREQQQQRETLRGRQLELLHARTRARNAGADATAKVVAARAREQRLAERGSVLRDEAGRIDAELAQWRS